MTEKPSKRTLERRARADLARIFRQLDHWHHTYRGVLSWRQMWLMVGDAMRRTM